MNVKLQTAVRRTEENVLTHTGVTNASVKTDTKGMVKRVKVILGRCHNDSVLSSRQIDVRYCIVFIENVNTETTRTLTKLRPR